jgi:hypothetical protein
MIGQPEREQLNRLTVKTLDQVFIMQAKEGDGSIGRRSGPQAAVEVQDGAGGLDPLRRRGRSSISSLPKGATGHGGLASATD